MSNIRVIDSMEKMFHNPSRQEKKLWDIDLLFSQKSSQHGLLGFVGGVFLRAKHDKEEYLYLYRDIVSMGVFFFHAFCTN